MARWWSSLLAGWLVLAVAGAAVAEEGEFLRQRALALYEERCAPFRDDRQVDSAPADYLQLQSWGYTPDEILRLAEQIPETCLELSFLDAVATVIRTSSDPQPMPPLGTQEVVAEPFRPLEGPELALPIAGVSLVVATTLMMWFLHDREGAPGRMMVMTTGVSLCVLSVGLTWTPDRPRPLAPSAGGTPRRSWRWSLGPASLQVRF